MKKLIIDDGLVDSIKIGDLKIENFSLEIGAMNYGFELAGIIGLDFLKQVDAVINLDKLTLYRYE